MHMMVGMRGAALGAGQGVTALLACAGCIAGSAGMSRSSQHFVNSGVQMAQRPVRSGGSKQVYSPALLECCDMLVMCA